MNPVDMSLSPHLQTTELSEELKARYARNKSEDILTAAKLAIEFRQKIDELHPDVLWKIQSLLQG